MFQLTLKAFFKSTILLLAFSLFACAPTDENVFSYKQRLDSGKPLIYNRSGEQAPDCRRTWDEIRLSQEEIEDLYFLGTLPASAYGDRNCFVVGSKVYIYNKETKRTLSDLVVIKDVVLWKPNLEKRNEYLKYVDDGSFKVDLEGDKNSSHGKELSSYIKNLFNSYVVRKASSSDDGTINITHIELTQRLEPSAKEFRKNGQDRFKNSLDYFDSTSSEKPLLESCKGLDWTDGYRVNQEEWALIQSGMTHTLWQVWDGRSACVRHQANVKLVSRENPDQTLGSFKVTHVHELSRGKVEEAFQNQLIRLTDKISEEKVKTEIEYLFKKNRNPQGAHLFLITFENLEVTP